MDINEVKTFLENTKNEADTIAFVTGLNPITLDKVKEFVVKDTTAKSWMNSENDAFFNKAHSTWETNVLPKLLSDAVSKANPAETPEQKTIRELTERLNKRDEDMLRNELGNKALKVISDKKLPIDLEAISLFIGLDEATTLSNIDKFEKGLEPWKQSLRDEILKSGSYTPPNSDKTPITKNPWSKENFNLTLQGKLLKENPTLASQYMAQAKN